MMSILEGGQKITRYEGERPRIGCTPSNRALALNIATCQYAKPLAIALCAAGYTSDMDTISMYSTVYTQLLTAPAGFVTTHGHQNPSWPYAAPATLDILPPPPMLSVR